MSVWQPWSVADDTKLTAILFPTLKFTEGNQWKAATADIPQYKNVETLQYTQCSIIMLTLGHEKFNICGYKDIKRLPIDQESL